MGTQIRPDGQYSTDRAVAVRGDVHAPASQHMTHTHRLVATELPVRFLGLSPV